jgi:hypothetical protein
MKRGWPAILTVRLATSYLHNHASNDRDHGYQEEPPRCAAGLHDTAKLETFGSDGQHKKGQPPADHGRHGRPRQPERGPDKE